MNPLLRRWIRLAVAAATAGSVVLTAPLPAHADPDPDQQIVGGTVADWADYPYLVRLDGCSASLISPTKVLTAQHCVAGRTVPPQATFSNGVTVPTQVYSTMPGYVEDSPGYDLAVLSVPAWATAGVPYVPQVGSPWRPGNYQPGVEATLAGFGLPSPDSDPTEFGTLRAIDTPIRSDDAMDDIYNPWYGPDWWISRLMIGAGGSAHTTCYGDSGTALTVNQDGNRIVQVGVHSFGLDCTAAAALMELSGPQLAWLASMVPSVQDGWGPCTAPNGQPGRPDVRWGQGIPEGGSSENGRPWSIRCVVPQPMPPPPVPDPEDDPPPPRDCPPRFEQSARPCPKPR
ncbi:hypothetical protein Aph01nite_29490 [Acrocarpospora phusangensis]|uniref:Peptidase S1 domain-containing protein n=1 Tax=Acrocarpospora phusangensis TaxID=1070424 RepID=A0A919QBF0_9ACTN|nr:trypsin-like serine protease [Acrocarpospora phusangensis]GIH24639.1 hypothetical protein Aph01nite_29490 [Acrocarpospora phusangensis]